LPSQKRPQMSSEPTQSDHEGKHAFDCIDRIECGTPYEGFVPHSVPSGEPVQRPPLFREEDGVLVRASKVVVYIVLSPAIGLYIVYDNAGSILEWTVRVVRRGAEGLAQVVLYCGAGVGYLLDKVLYRRVLLPLASGCEATARALYSYVLRPVGSMIVAVASACADALRWTLRVTLSSGEGASRWLHGNLLVPLFNGACAGVRSLWRGGCLVADGLRRYLLVPVFEGAAAVARGLHRLIVVPLYNGALAVLDGVSQVVRSVGRGVVWVGQGLVTGVCRVASGLHAYILVPLYHGTAAIIIAVGHGVGWVAGALWRGTAAVIYGTLTGVAWAVERLWQGGCFVAGGLHRHILVPLYHGVLAAGKGVWDYVLSPTGKGIWNFVLLPTYKGVVAVARGVRTLTLSVGKGIQSVGKGIHRHVVLPAYHAAVSVGKGVYVGAVAAGNATADCVVKPVGRAMSYSVRAVGSAVAGAAVAAARGIASVASAVAGAVKATASALFTNVLRPVGSAVGSVVAAAASVVGSAVAAAASAIGSAAGAALSAARHAASAAREAGRALRGAARGLAAHIASCLK